MKLPDSVVKGWNIIGKIQGAVVVFFLVFTMALIFAQVILRYVFNAPLLGIEDYLLIPIAWMYMIGAALASFHRAHIDCGIILLYIKRKTTYKLLMLMRSALMLGVCLWLLKWAYWYWLYLLRVDKTSALGYIRMVYVESAAFFGILLMTIFAAVEFADWALIMSGKKEVNFVPIGGGISNDN